MIDDDWRLINQERYLKNVSLIYTKFNENEVGHDHMHCEFCFAKFMEDPDELNWGYCTTNKRHWICKTCFEDFKDMFGWKVIESNV